MFAGGQQPPGPRRRVATLYLNEFEVSEDSGVLYQAGRRLAQHHAAGRRGGLHPLGQPDLLTDGCVTRFARTDFSGDDLARVQADPQWQRGADVLLDVQRSEAGAESMIFQRGWRTEHRHDAVAGELIHRSAVALYNCRGAIEQVGHDLA